MALHPFVAAMLEQIRDLPALSGGTADDARALVAAGRARLGKGPATVAARDLRVAGRSRDIPVRLLTPREDCAGTIVFLHGGGWVVGALDDYDTYARTLADRTGFAVVMVDYRLAPEHPFPAGLEDCEDALAAALERAIPAAPARGPIVVMGDSAGANLATVCCARLDEPSRVALQVLYYPVTDHDFTRASYAAHGTGLPLTARDMAWFFRHYAPEEAWANPAISPLRNPVLSGLPRAVVVMAEYDVLADEGCAYAGRLEQAGVAVTRRVIPGVTHGFIRLHNLLDLSDDELSTVAGEIRDTAGS